jgi:chromosome segregation ATPase
MEIPQRIACRAINCNKTFSDQANERKHSRKKHPELIGSVGISLQQQAQVQDIPNSDPFYEEEVFVTEVAFAEGEKTSLQDKSGKDSTEIVSLKRLITEKDIIISNLDSDLNIARDEVVAAKAEKTHMSKDFTLKCSALKDVITVLSTEKNQLDDTITELKNTKIKLVESYSDLCKSSINSKDSLIATIATLKEQLKKQENSLVSLQADFDYLKVVFKFNDRLPTYL